MASPKLPGQITLPPLTDPNNVKETFGNQLMGINYCDGIVHLTISMIRPRHKNPGSANDNENVVVLRPTFPMAVLDALVEAHRQLNVAMTMQQQNSKPN